MEIEHKRLQMNENIESAAVNVRLHYFTFWRQFAICDERTGSICLHVQYPAFDPSYGISHLQSMGHKYGDLSSLFTVPDWFYPDCDALLFLY